MSQDRQHSGEQEVSQGSYASWWLEAEIQRQREAQEQQGADDRGAQEAGNGLPSAVRYGLGL